MGIPTSSLTCEGFFGQAKATAPGLGYSEMPLALVPGHAGVQSAEELRRNTLEVTLPRVIENLINASGSTASVDEPGVRDIVCKGTFEDVNEDFLKHEWSDGLPIVPP